MTSNDQQTTPREQEPFTVDSFRRGSSATREESDFAKELLKVIREGWQRAEMATPPD